ncbi:hypothetical protein CEXT_190531 [Caerostris extrusa]|uniref:Uncharacterized protein n=1 Tax=Caerostris extrusa TaxID=172846 RepID=A0AAV4MHC8_CAEEX|nr:hypothetical protein CEXT_190531 [Caerostris extrusa]
MMPRGEEFFDPPNAAVNQEKRNGRDAGAEKSLSPAQLPSSAACLLSRPPDVSENSLNVILLQYDGMLANATAC